MINSFWNICSTCPMPKEEKLNSEYKRNYVWHPQYKPLAQDVISCAPQSIVKEIGIQRKKQYPELAYRSHEVIRHDIGAHSKYVIDSRARSEERDNNLTSKSGPRSRSAEPGMEHHQQKSVCHDLLFCTDTAVPKVKLAPVHRPCVKHKEATSLEKPLQDTKKKVKTEYKAKYKPFTSYVYVDGQWKKTSRLLKVMEKAEDIPEEPWFVEVAERVQKANEYRSRGHGHSAYGELLPDISKQPSEVPHHRSKRIPNELQLNLPKCHESTSKKADSKKKETPSEGTEDKKLEKGTRKLRRPKSAEPAKAKETVKYKRPATTPPAKLSTHSLPSRKKTPKSEESDRVPKTKQPRKPREHASKPPSSSSSSAKKSPTPSSQSSGGKVWLQAGPSIPEATGKEDSPMKEHSDAVRPSSLSPISSASVAPQEPSATHNNVEIPNKPEDAKFAVSQSSVVPLTHVRTPEEVTGVKSPDPENWTVPIENSERLQWSGVNTPETPPPKYKAPEDIAEKLTKTATPDETVPLVSQDTDVPLNSGKITPANVLDRARSRLDQFWGKNK
ncbi:histone-lysine N-methyltransferase 2B isoform X4 [Parasteatoda tepidariorum]|uniref:histone-lysine N-methyltransferase 2B isoform X4 n=1 Tax=Parasteatoda tepidariorum TaxID=114398 RepID=UPI00077F9C7D|nr:proteoglycan 4 isoform X3 [Parasteatoda tepidariorum]